MGGFSDDRQLSQKLTHQLLSKYTAFSPTRVKVCTPCCLRNPVLVSAKPRRAPLLGAPGAAQPGFVQKRGAQSSVFRG